MVANEILWKILGLANQVLPEEPPLARTFALPKKALLVPSLFIGDNILLTPFIRALRQNLGPEAELDIVTPRATGALFDTNPHLNRIWIEKEGSLRRPKVFLESRKYDTVFFCRYSIAWGRAALQAGISQRVGFNLERIGIQRFSHWGRCLTHSLPSSSIYDSRPQAEIYLEMLNRLGLADDGLALECPLTEADREKAARLLDSLSHRPKVLIHAASGSPGKQWPLENWQALLREIRDRWDPIFVAIGGKGEAPQYQALEEEFNLANWCGQTNLRESIALLQGMDLVITLDTSIAHLAALAGTPRLVVMYGPTNERQWRPMIQPGAHLEQVYLNLPCRPCMARTCEHRGCVLRLGPAQVLLAVERVMGHL